MGNDVSKVKRVGNYIAALFKLGRTERMAKEAHRNMREIEERFNSWEIRERQLRNGIKQMVQSDTQALMARNAELARNFVELSRRLDQVLLTTQSDQAPFVQTDQPAPDESGIGAVMDSFITSWRTNTAAPHLISATGYASTFPMLKAQLFALRANPLWTLAADGGVARPSE